MVEIIGNCLQLQSQGPAQLARAWLQGEGQHRHAAEVDRFSLAVDAIDKLVTPRTI